MIHKRFDFTVASDIIITMRIINNTDINNLIIFAKKNLGIYKLVYRKQKFIYCLSIVSSVVSVLMLIIYLLFIVLHINAFLEKICVSCCLLIALCSLGLLAYIGRKTLNSHLIIQDVRFQLLMEYYTDKKYNANDKK